MNTAQETVELAQTAKRGGHCVSSALLASEPSDKVNGLVFVKCGDLLLPKSPLDEIFSEPTEPQESIELGENTEQQKEAQHFVGKVPKRRWLPGMSASIFVSAFLAKSQNPELASFQSHLEELFEATLTFCELKLDEAHKELRMCPKCSTKKPLSAFRKNPTWCKSCLFEKEKKARSSVSHKIRTTNYQREYMRRYRAANPEREAKTVLKALAKKPEMLMTEHRGMVSLNHNFENGRERSLAVASDLSPDEAMMLAEEMEAENNQ